MTLASRVAREAIDSCSRFTVGGLESTGTHKTTPIKAWVRGVQVICHGNSYVMHSVVVVNVRLINPKPNDMGDSLKVFSSHFSSSSVSANCLTKLSRLG